jgi:DNA-binding protein HU-beta
MTKAEFIDHVVKSSKGSEINKKAAGELIDGIFDAVGEAIKKDQRFSYPGFGTFVVKERAARKGRNPRTGDPIDIEASKTISFKPAPTLKQNLEAPAPPPAPTGRRRK